MTDFFLWFIFINIMGWLAFPLCFSLCKKAGDRGYFISKVIGLLLWGYIYWIGNVFNLVGNNQSGAVTALVLLMLLSAYFIKKNGFSVITAWIKENRQIVIFHEALFLAAFLGWAIVRGGNPEISGTEKPMELAFINGIFKSPSFPPNDPWLSGYSISYYYFGYLIVAALMHLLGTVSGVAFNLALALTFALVASISSGILINLLVHKEVKLGLTIDRKRLRRILLVSLLAPLMILIMSNAEGFLEVLHSKGLFWDETGPAEYQSGFWQWLDIQDLRDGPMLPLDWIPSRMGGTWWWRASRVLTDTTAAGDSREIIDEFPYFSFLLGDLHPHVLAMPYVLLAIYIGFYMFQHPLEGMKGKNSSWKYILQPALWIIALTTGSLIFMNTWDFPIYFGLIALTFIVPSLQKNGWKKEVLIEFLQFVIPFGFACIILYAPFILSLSSQAGGLLPSLLYRTRMAHFLVMFFPQMIILTVFLTYKTAGQKEVKGILKIFLYCVAAAIVAFLGALLVPKLSQQMPRLLAFLGDLAGVDMQYKVQNMLASNQSFLGIYGADSTGELIQMAVRRFIKYPLMILLLLAFITTGLFLLFWKGADTEDEQPGNMIEDNHNKADQYVLILVLLASLLTIFPEFFYLRDQFGWRMNTIFKFYFQAWILFSLASAYAVSSLAYLPSRPRKTIYTIGAVLVIGVGLVYPGFSIFNKTNSFRNIEWSLDGNLFYKISHPEDVEAIEYLATQPYGTVAEAIGGSYSNYARVSRLSGYPAVLGWPGHESQWRGGAREMGSRQSNIQQLYETHDWETTRQILDQYDIRYVFIGSIERNQYQVREDKFANHMTIVFNNTDVIIYAYSGID